MGRARRQRCRLAWVQPAHALPLLLRITAPHAHTPDHDLLRHRVLAHPDHKQHGLRNVLCAGVRQHGCREVREAARHALTHTGRALPIIRTSVSPFPQLCCNAGMQAKLQEERHYTRRSPQAG